MSINLSFIDWLIIIMLIIASVFCRLADEKATKRKTADFFLSGKNMPWWLLGISIVSSTFSCDTPNLVTQLVREQGISGNWVWWCFLLTGMLNVFIYARYWKKSGTLNDLDFYALRYGNDKAKSIRIFRSVYLGLFFNCLVMSTVNLAVIKIGLIFFDLSAVNSILIASSLVLVYTFFLGNHRGIWGDLWHFCIAMAGAVWAAIISFRHIKTNYDNIASFTDLLNNDFVIGKTSLLPDFSNPASIIPFFFIPLAAQWWMVWYPGAEPGGGGYVVDKMLSAKNEKHAIGATLFYNIINYALRPWPWIIVAFCSLVVFPSVNSISSAFPNIPKQFIANDLAYPAMLTRLGAGWTGLIVATLLLAYISTIGTHLNHGINYLVEDCYAHFVNKEASEKKHRLFHFIIMVVMLIVSGLISLNLKSAWQCFEILLLVGAGTGPVYLCRWLWWRITPRTEIVAMLSAIVMMILLEFFPGDRIFSIIEINRSYHSSIKLLLACGVTTFIWIFVTKLSTPAKDDVLVNFFTLTQPNSRGWRPIQRIIEKRQDNLQLVQDGSVVEQKGKRNVKAESSVLLGGVKQSLGLKVLNIFMGTITIYSFLFCVGSLVFQNFRLMMILGLISLMGTWLIYSLNEQKK